MTIPVQNLDEGAGTTTPAGTPGAATPLGEAAGIGAGPVIDVSPAQAGAIVGQVPPTVPKGDAAGAGTGGKPNLGISQQAEKVKAEKAKANEGKPRFQKHKPGDDLTELLTDAKIVALYGQRTGQLPDNSLQIAIAAVSAKDELSWADDDVAQLQAAFNSAVAALSPVTLLDLRSGWNPFQRSRRKTFASSIKNSIFLIFAGLLILGAATSTFVLNKGTGIVLALEKLKEQEPQRRIGQLQRQLLNAQPITSGPTSPETILAREAYFSTLDDLRDIDQRLSMYMPLSLSFPADYGNVLVLARNEFLRPTPPPVPGLPPSGDFGKPPPPPSGGANAATNYASMNTSCELAKTSGQYNGSAFAKTEIGKMFIQYQADALNLFCYQGLLYQPSMVPPLEARLGAMNQAMSIYALWILPAIYGALGATIFFMRSVLDPLTPDPPFGKILLRVALGALAGIVLGWFWSPENTLSSDVAKIGFSLFATSFIVGFSIEVFFAMLDRFVNIARDFFTEIGA